MKKLILFCLLAGACCISAWAQQYSINWYKVAGGGASSNGQYSVSGTIGQPDASGALTGGNYSVTGGFWAIIQAVQTPGAPNLCIGSSGNTVTVYWQNVSGWTLQQSSSLSSQVWTSSSSPTLVNGTNYLYITQPTGNLFFKLSSP